MSDRLDELKRQRALAEEQMARLEREIAREKGEPIPVPAPSAPDPKAASPALSRPPSAATKDIDTEAARIFAHYNKDQRSPQEEVKRGCMIYFIGAMTFLIVGVGIWALLKHWSN